MAKPKTIVTKLQVIVPVTITTENNSRFDLAKFNESVIEYFDENGAWFGETLTADQSDFEGNIAVSSPIRIEKAAR